MIYTPAQQNKRKNFSLSFPFFHRKKKRRVPRTTTFSSTLSLSGTRVDRYETGLPQLSLQQIQMIIYFVGICSLIVLIWQFFPRPVISPVSKPPEIKLMWK